MKTIYFYIFLFISNCLAAQNLKQYQQKAAEQNPGLQAKYKAFEAALQQIPQVKSLQDPTFSVGYFISPVETRVGPQRVKFSLSQMFPWFGTLKAKGDAAALLADAKYQTFIDARNKLSFQVAAAYYPLYELNKLKHLEQENIDILESYKTVSTRQFENGNGPMADVLRVDIMLKEAVTNLKILNNKEKTLLTTFNMLLSRDQQATVAIQDTLSVQQLPENFRRDSLFDNNPILKELELRSSASAAMETAATRQALPKFGVGLDYVVVGEGEMPAADNGKDVIMPMVSLSIPIFRSKYKAAVKEAQLMQESYALQKNDYTNSLIAGYESILFELSQQQELIYLYRDQIKESQQVLNLLFSAYSNSGQQFEEVLQMQQQLLKYERLIATALTKYNTEVARLDYITAKHY